MALWLAAVRTRRKAPTTIYIWYSRDDLEDSWHPDYLPPADVLQEIEAAILRAGLITTKPVGSAFWRAQLHGCEESLGAPERFTSPPIEYANQPNRMSPAGIPMFYCAENEDTSISEVLDPQRSRSLCVSTAQFNAVVPLNVLDLTSIPPPPSYFSADGPDHRHVFRFLLRFATNLSQPIVRDGRQHIEYVPTQVFTEFVRFIMKGSNEAPIHGIRYSSSRDGKPCLVIFATQAECLPPHGPLDSAIQMLKFVPSSIKTVQMQ